MSAVPTEHPQIAEHEAATKKKVMVKISAAFLIAALCAFLYWLLIGRFYEETDDAYVQGNLVQITPKVAGTVASIHADDTDLVRSGEPLVGLETVDADIELAQAEAQLAQTVREVRATFATEAQSVANLNLRQVELRRAQDNLARRMSVVGSGAVSDEEIDHAELALSEARAALSVARKQLESARAMTSGTSVTEHPNVKRAIAKFHEAAVNQARTTIYAPVSGQVIRRNVQIGQRINSGVPLMAIVPLNQIWVDANFKESQLREMRIGQPVTLISDLYGHDVQYKGKVIGVAAGAGSVFALLPPQNATGNWIKVVQRVPVRIALDPAELERHPLRIGLSVRAIVDLHDRRDTPAKPASSTKMVAYPAVEASIEESAKARIEAIIAANLK